MRLKTLLLIVVLTVVISSQTSFAALNAYLYLEGETQGVIEGSVTQAGREDTIMVIAYSHIISSPRDETCQPSGKLNHLPVSITKEIDKSTPLLFKAFVDHERMKEFRLEFWQPSSSGQEVQHYTVILEGAYIAGINQEMLNNKYLENMQHKEREHISFTYDQVRRIWKEGGIEAYSIWDSDCGRYVLTSDLNFDGVVNFLDLRVLADEWLKGF